MRVLAIMLALVALLGLRPSSPKGAVAPIPAPVGAEEVWQMTLPESIRIAPADAEVVRHVMIGTQEIPLGGFEPAAEAAGGDREPDGR